MSLLHKACFFLSFAMLSLASLPAQQGGGKPAAAAAPASTSGLAGLSYVRGDWSTSMPTDSKRVVLCYKLVPANSSSQPFTLEPTRFDCNNDKADPVVRNACQVSKNSPCSIVDNTHPLLERQILVLAIDARNLAASLKDEELGKIDHPPVNISRMAVLNFNLTTQQGTALNPAPVRPSMSTASLATGNLGPSIYYLRWPIQLMGDTIPTLTVNTVYIAPAPGDFWSPSTVYAAGSVVTPLPGNGHFYTALNEGMSGSGSGPAFAIVTPATVNDPAVAGPALTWMDVGTTAPIGAATPATWTPNKQFTQGSVIANPTNGHFYVASIGGQSGSTMPTFPVATPASIADPPGGALMWTDVGTTTPIGTVTPVAVWSPGKPFSQNAVIANPLNGHFYLATTGGRSGNAVPSFPVATHPTVPEPNPPSITWTDLGTTAPSGLPATVPQWTPNTTFTQGQVISNPLNSHFYLASTGGQSGTAMPALPVTVKPPIQDGTIIWQDSGTSTPASVSTAGPTDQVVSLLNVPLPQVHSLYYFNLATGVAVSWVRNPSFLRLENTPPSPPGTATYYTQKVPGSLTVEPILLFTTYLPKLAMDAESPWKPKNLIPGFSFGFSLSAPASSFYIGGSSEIWRNLQFAGGLNVAKVNALAPAGYVDPTSSTAPTTIQKFAKGAFIGFTLNIDFIAGLFGQKI
jgi:hypothetical protein